MKESALFVLVSISIILLVLTNIHIIKTSTSFEATVQTAKSQLDQSEKGIVNIPQPDYRIATVLSITSFLVGIGIGWAIFRKC